MSNPGTSDKQLTWRRNQIQLAKQTPEYRFYVSRVPVSLRNDDDPQTPRVGMERGKKVFTAIYLEWRRALHAWVNRPENRESFEEFELFVPTQEFVDCQVCFKRTDLCCSCCKIACCSTLCQDEIHPELKNK